VEGAVSGECPLFVAPVGVVTLTAGEFGRSPTLCRALLGDDAATTAHGHGLQYLAFPAVHLSLARVLGLSTPTSSPRWEVTRSHLTNGSGEGSAHAVLQLLQGNKGHLLPATFAVDLVRDLFSAVAHMTTWYGRRRDKYLFLLVYIIDSCRFVRYSGVYLRWLSVDHLYLTSAGKLKIGGLSGAVMASYSTTTHCDTAHGVLHGTARASADAPVSNSEEVFSLAALGERLTAQKNQHHSASKQSTKTHKSRPKRKFSLNPFDDEDEEDNNNTAADRVQARLRNMAKKLGFPRAALYTVAPEVLLGAGASPESTVYSAAAVAVQLLTGRPLVKVRR
jgi:hypothetical protein